MKKYRKKPVIIEAVKLTKDNIREVYEELNGKIELKSRIDHEKWYDYEMIVEREGIDVNTPEGTVKLKIGSYLVKGYSKKLGYHYWPVDADYFVQSYELAE